MYELEIEERCERELWRHAGKNRGLQIQIDKKIEEIRQHPLHYKPLRRNLFGLRRVHIGPFVLLFQVDEARRVIRLVRFGHHDEAYEF